MEKNTNIKNIPNLELFEMEKMCAHALRKAENEYIAFQSQYPSKNSDENKEISYTMNNKVKRFNEIHTNILEEIERRLLNITFEDGQ